jgi:hypothetical protein
LQNKDSNWNKEFANMARWYEYIGTCNLHIGNDSLSLLGLLSLVVMSLGLTIDLVQRSIIITIATCICLNAGPAFVMAMPSLELGHVG